MSRSRLIFGLVALVAAMVVGALVLLPGGSTLVNTALPTPNGYEFITQAGALVKPLPKDVEALDREELAATVRDNHGALELARKGLALPCKLPMPANWNEMNQRLTTLSFPKSLAFAFVAEGRLRALGGDFSGAARSYLDVVKLGPAVARGGMIVDLMNGQSITALGAGRLLEVSQRLSRADCRACADGLTDHIRRFPAVQEMEANEEYFRARVDPLRWRMISRISYWMPSMRQARADIRAKSEQRSNDLYKRAAELAARAGTMEKQDAR